MINLKKKGDLYWNQLSMWDFSKKENVDAYSAHSFHYELYVVTQDQINNSWKATNLTWDEVEIYQLDLINLTPAAGDNWSRVTGNIEGYK